MIPITLKRLLHPRNHYLAIIEVIVNATFDTYSEACLHLKLVTGDIPSFKMSFGRKSVSFASLFTLHIFLLSISGCGFVRLEGLFHPQALGFFCPGSLPFYGRNWQSPPDGCSWWSLSQLKWTGSSAGSNEIQYFNFTWTIVVDVVAGREIYNPCY